MAGWRQLGLTRGNVAHALEREHSCGFLAARVHVGVAGKHGAEGRARVHGEYVAALARSQVVVTCNPKAWEGDARLAEALSSGAVVLVDAMLNPPPGVVNGSSVLTYRSIDEMLSLVRELRGARLERRGGTPAARTAAMRQRQGLTPASRAKHNVHATPTYHRPTTSSTARQRSQLDSAQSRTPLVAPVPRAAGTEDRGLCELAAGASTEVTRKNGQTPLLEACVNGHVPCVKLLLEAGADCNAVDGEGKSAMQLAEQSAKGSAAIKELLKEYGASE